MTMQDWFQNPIVRGAITGAATAAYVDFAAFRAWKSWHDVSAYAWGTASFRWVVGGVIGAVVALLTTYAGIPPGTL
jgi:hypothetical protein